MIFEQEIHPSSAAVLNCSSEGCETTMADAAWPKPFTIPLQYASPARGTWTIAHSPMLIPHCHEIYVCCACCLHGVVLSAEEIPHGGWDRFSMITATNENIIKGNLEQMMIDGVGQILDEMEEKPEAVECFTSCIQHFLHMDAGYVYKVLRKKYPEIDFIDGYMIPTLQRRFAPDVLGRRQLMRAIHPAEKKILSMGQRERAVNLAVNYYPVDPDSELVQMFVNGGYAVRELASCKNYADYQAMGASCASLYFLANSKPAAEDMEKRLGIPAVPAYYSWNYDEIESTERRLAEEFHLSLPDFPELREKCDAMLEIAWAFLKGRPIEIDYTATPRLLSLTRLLLEHGFNVRAVYADAFLPEDETDYSYIKQSFPALTVRSATHYKMRLLFPSENADSQTVAIGQKAAYFSGTSRFVNMVENGADPRTYGTEEERSFALAGDTTRPVELYGFEGIVKFCMLLIEAASQDKDIRRIIQTKAWGCTAGQETETGQEAETGLRTETGQAIETRPNEKAAGTARLTQENVSCISASSAAQRVLSTYAVDLFGMTSALYELGGLCVMHDASGCNSTYTTHDEPRWYDTPSLVVISGLNEIDTIEGNDRRLIDHIAEAARETHPRFIAVGGSPMPNAIGTDFRAVARLVERRTGIPTLGIRTDGIHSYVTGAGEAFRVLAERFVKDPVPAVQKKEETGASAFGGIASGSQKTEETGASAFRGVNILGLTPLDFSVAGNATAFREICASHAIPVVSSWAMGGTLKEMEHAAEASVNCVVSSTGLPAAKYLEKMYGTPYVTGIPIGKRKTEEWVQSIRDAARTSRSGWFEDIEVRTSCSGWSEDGTVRKDGMEEKSGRPAPEPTHGSRQESEQSKFMPDLCPAPEPTHGLRQGLQSLTSWEPRHLQEGRCRLLLIGEPVFIRALRAYLAAERGIPAEEIRMLCPIADAPLELVDCMEIVPAEEDLREECRRADRVLADPYYARLLPDEPSKFIAMPHEAYSGRHFRSQALRFVGPFCEAVL